MGSIIIRDNMRWERETAWVRAGERWHGWGGARWETVPARGGVGERWWEQVIQAMRG